ncbi:MAG: DNA mismatch repair protein [Chrysothrix sp. TS-e1954]|nr:MAG: DNA mismatch repair protein [Chrysothrix sp. TS-e1954]
MNEVEARPEGNEQHGESLFSLEAPRRIRALDQDVVNKIAAGEIIVAPVHALKELTENAVDAGSTLIEVLVKDGGLKLLQISDNGHGIDREDLPILCERFTTSKLKAFEDLTSIGTYGFRGEALASISHIAHLQVTSKSRESSCAWKAIYADGKLVPGKPGQSADPKPCAGKQGTQITVEDLFYNVPTRRRAFRSASEEYSRILDLLGRYAVHCSGVGFSCKKHGDSSLGISVSASATTIDRIRQVHGSAVANELIDLEASSDRWGFKATGRVSNANYHVKKLIFLLFINHRAVESSAIKKAIEQTYSIFLPKGTHPFVYLSLEIDPQRVDVNVHPTKREVNFLNEDEIIESVCDEIRTRLGKVDTSRTFMTQSLLPGVQPPAVSSSAADSPTQTPKTQQAPDSGGKFSSFPTRQTPIGTRPYENNLIRTDSKARKITSMYQTVPQHSDRSIEDDSRATTAVGEADNVNQILRSSSSMNYEQVVREPRMCRLTTIKDLRAAVRDDQHNGLTDIFATHTFVGLVDTRRRLAALQAGVKLLLVDYGLIFAEYFYQLGLTDFGNFGTIKLDPPLRLNDILTVAAEAERKLVPPDDADSLNWEEVVSDVHDEIMSRRDMLAEYFSFDLSPDGDLQGLPLLIKGYAPSMAKLPRFLLRLGPHVNWTDERECFRTFLRELAAWYVPEPQRQIAKSAAPSRTDAGEAPDEDVEMLDSSTADDNEKNDEEEQEIATRRAELQHAIEHVLFPAVKARLVATKGLLKGVVEIANLKGLYRVFERC